MANSKSAIKRVRVSSKKKLQNSSKRSSLRKTMKRANTVIENEEKDNEAILKAVKAVDQAVSNGIVHRNKGARVRSKLIKALNK
ncbi:MAG: 30S ribosomal protein S20 [Clostridiaceae bacterium]|nr:30S ribosomal protein S20 [Clostridiaceae bacterium]